MIETEVVVIGGGIAGASIAAGIAEARSVLLLEREDQPGYHTSGRSAALFSEAYGNAPIRALSIGSRAFLEAPPAGFSEHPLLSPRGALHVGAAADQGKLDALLVATQALVPSVRRVSAAEARALVPVLRPEILAGGVLEPDAMDIDTNAMLQGFLRLLKARGGRTVMRAEVSGFERRADGWRIETRAGPVAARLVVNAAGSWCDEIAGLAGLSPCGLVPYRRTAFLFEPPAGLDIRAWPIFVGANEDFYVKPDAGLLLGSPAEETPSPPSDAQPEDLDIAIAVERIQEVADLPVRRIARRWAGLRTFAPDRTPVVGFAPGDESFFWYAGQGGYGFQTAPALARLGAALALGRAVPSDLADRGIAAATVSPARLATAPGAPA